MTKAPTLISVFFVIDGRRMEKMAAILAASIHQHNGTKYQKFAYVPKAGREHLSRLSRKIFDACEVEIRDIEPHDHLWAQPYPHGNKLLAATDNRGTTSSFFFDSDMICTKPLDLETLVSDNFYAAVPEGVRTFGAEPGAWESVYDLFGMPLPEERVKLTKGRRVESLPYFNAGFIGMSDARDAQGETFADTWLKTAIEIDRAASVQNKRPWLDQISLPVAGYRRGTKFTLLGNEYNFSLFRTHGELPTFPRILHYHHAATLKNWVGIEQSADYIRDLLPSKFSDRINKNFAKFFP